MTTFLKKAICEGCLGSTMQVNEYDIVRPCPDCTTNYEKFSNVYGTQKEDAPMFYVDATQPGKAFVQKIDRNQEHLLLPNGKVIYLKYKSETDSLEQLSIL